MPSIQKDKIRVMHVIPTLALGGTPRLMLDLTEHLHRSGSCEVQICVLGRSAQTCGKYHPVVEPVYLECPCRYRHMLEMLDVARRLRSHIRAEKPDIVHSYLWLADVITAAAIFKTDSRHISHIVDRRTGFASSRWKHRLKKNLVRYFLRRAGTKYISVSQACTDYACRYLGVPERIVSLAYNSIDPENYHFENRPFRAPVRIGAAGRMVEEKGQVYLLEAARLLKDQGVEYHLVIDGDGPLRQALEQRAKWLNISDNVDFCGFSPSMPEFYRHLDVFVVSSVDSEGLPTTLLEAMASGCAIVSTDIGGSGEVVRSGREGLLVAPRSPQAIADGIVTFMKDEPFRRNCVASARKRIIERFTMKQMVADVLTAYHLMPGMTS